MVTETPCSAASTLPQTCNGAVGQSLGVPTQLEVSMIGSDALKLTPNYYAGGIYGWRKRCLYLLVIMLLIVVVINMALTVWIIKVLDLTTAGMGSLTFTKYGAQIQGETEFLNSLQAANIQSLNNHPLKLESSGNISLMAVDYFGNPTNKLTLGNSVLEAKGKHFLVRGNVRGVLFHVEPEEVVMSANGLRVSESGGFRLEGSLQTTLLRGSSTKDLRIESPMKTLDIRGDAKVEMESRVGEMNANCLRDMKLQSTEGRVILDTSKLEMKNLKVTRSFNRDHGFQRVYQMCMCENGRLFLAMRESHCQTKESICNEKPEARIIDNGRFSI
ncbi:zeta-sarcoglycan-like [Centruroides sculpturatus]|uniref:zeta-sarcoglycan-like n=1 Tax=Centruroides sculpturatus TaxID=218467 RepID=UPI000C6D680A|nr:zeta-sarcoglycan-like [Centruroides sculpturatus]